MDVPQASFLEDLGSGLIIALAVALISGVVGAVYRFTGAKAWLIDRWHMRRFRRAAPQIVVEQSAHMTHLRDAMDVFWRARESPRAVREWVRLQILEPIAGTLTSGPGEQIKVVWWRPNNGELFMYDQVGHSPEGQEAMRLPRGGGLAGRAFATGEFVYSPDCRNDERFQDVERSKADGSLACAPIKRGTAVTGVLSVLSNWTDRFWLHERLYFETLAAAIAAAEVLEEEERNADVRNPDP